MALASNYFHDANNADRQTLHRRIRPSASQFEEQQDRWNSVRDYLRPKLQERSGHPTRSWLQGSYKFGTQIRPVKMGGEFDIDLGVYYCWAGQDDEGNFGPADLQTFVQEALRDFEAENDDVVRVAAPPKERCCRVHFEGDFHIDVPAYHLDEQDDRRALATKSDEWEASDPKAIYVWFVSEFDDYQRDRVRRLIRYFKAWAALKFDPDEGPSSVLLTVLAANAVSRLGSDLPGPEDEAFRDAIAEMLDEVATGQDVRNPVDDAENLAARMDANQWSEFTRKLHELLDVAERAVECENEIEACTEWSIPFEHLFPLPEPEEIEKGLTGLPAVIALPEVSVYAVSRDNRQMTYNGTNEIGPIPKNCEITFRVRNAHAMPPGTRYLWVVRNEGEEAEDLNDLGHTAGMGTTASNTEHSAYVGTHYMDCTAIIPGHAPAIRRVKVQIRGIRAPKRHRPKPAYVRLRGRR